MESFLIIENGCEWDLMKPLVGFRSSACALDGGFVWSDFRSKIR